MKDPTLYVPVHAGLFAHRKLGRLSLRLGIAEVHAVGHLVSLWTSALQQTTDGVLRRWDEIDVARAARWTSKASDLLEALVAEEWLERAVEGDTDELESPIPEGTLMVRGWEDYAGRGMQYREKEKKRKAEARAAKRGGVSASVPSLSADKPALSADVPRQRNETKLTGTKRNETEKEEGESPAPPAPPLRPIMVVLPPEPQETLDERTDRVQGVALARIVQRDAFGAAYARAGELLGRPQAVKPLLALKVIEDADHVLRLAGVEEEGELLGKVWARRYAALDGKGEPRRASLSEVLVRAWASSTRWVWDLSGEAYLAKWGRILTEEAAKARYAWERDGAGTAADPERAKAKRKYVEQQGMGRDLAPFDTWYVEVYLRGRADDDLPEFSAADITPSSQGSGSRPAGPSSGSTRPPIAAVIAAADAQRSDPVVAAGGFDAMRAAQAAPRTITIPTTEVSS